MNGTSRVLVAAALVAYPALPQSLNDVKKDLEGAKSELKAQSSAIIEMELRDQLALLQDLPLLSPKPPNGIRVRTSDSAYDAGTSDLDQHRYESAIGRFDSVIAGKGPRADGALYWKAYALNRIGRREEALGALAALRKEYPGSHWLNDAQALEAELKQKAGQPISPAQEANEDIKLMAINSLMNADPDRAIPLLEGILKGSSSPRVKDRALFVLTQNRSARARQILTEYAKGAGNPDLQVRAIRYIGMAGTTDTQQQLASIYSSSGDVAVKREIIRSLMVSNGKDALFSLAKAEKDETLSREAIRQLGAMRASDQLNQLYASEQNPKLREEVITGLMMSGNTDRILEIARTEKDAAVRRSAIHALASQGDAKALVELARKESDPSVKKDIVSRLAMMRNKEATDYMMELLK